MKLKKWLTGVLAAAMALSLAACSDGGAESADAGSEDSITLGFAQVGSESEWRTANTDNIKAAAEAAGVTLQFSDAQQKQENQIKGQDSRLSAEEVRRLSSAYFLCRRRNEVNEMEATVQRKTLTMEDRKVLAEMWAAGERAAVIAVKLGVCPDTVYKELKRGYTGTLNELSRPAYDPARGQAEYQRRLRNRGRWRRDKEEHHGAEAET